MFLADVPVVVRRFESSNVGLIWNVSLCASASSLVARGIALLPVGSCVLIHCQLSCSDLCPKVYGIPHPFFNRRQAWWFAYERRCPKLQQVLDRILSRHLSREQVASGTRMDVGGGGKSEQGCSVVQTRTLSVVSPESEHSDESVKRTSAQVRRTFKTVNWCDLPAQISLHAREIRPWWGWFRRCDCAATDKEGGSRWGQDVCFYNSFVVLLRRSVCVYASELNSTTM